MQVSAAFDGAEKESVLDSQTLPLVKFFHCVSFFKPDSPPISCCIFSLPSTLPYSHSSPFTQPPATVLFSLALFAGFLFHVKPRHCLLYPRSYHLQIRYPFFHFKNPFFFNESCIIFLIRCPFMDVNHITVCSNVCASILPCGAETDALPQLAFELNPIRVAAAPCNPVDNPTFQWCAKEMRNRGCICSRVEERGCMYSMWNQMSCIIKPQVGHGAGWLNRIGSSPKMDFIDSARRARPSEVRQWPDWDAVTDPSASSVKSLELEWKIGRSSVDYVRIMKSFRSKIEEDI